MLHPNEGVDRGSQRAAGGEQGGFNLFVFFATALLTAKFFVVSVYPMSCGSQFNAMDATAH